MVVVVLRLLRGGVFKSNPSKGAIITYNRTHFFLEMPMLAKITQGWGGGWWNSKRHYHPHSLFVLYKVRLLVFSLVPIRSRSHDRHFRLASKRYFLHSLIVIWILFFTYLQIVFLSPINIPGDLTFPIAYNLFRTDGEFQARNFTYGKRLQKSCRQWIPQKKAETKPSEK